MSLPPPQAIESLRARLHALYADGSKHSIYQNVPEFVREALGYEEAIDERWRSDTPRYRYFVSRLGLPAAATVADVGANTGYFSLNLARANPGHSVQAFEPNPRHAAFIQEIASVFAIPNIRARPEVWTAGNLNLVGRFDAVFLLNILHHAGFDFDLQLADRNDAFEAYAGDYLRRLRQCTKWLCFQIGSNRGGDKSRPLFDYTDDSTRLVWTCRLLAGSGWRIDHVGIAGGVAGAGVCYLDLPDDLLAAARNNALQTATLSDYFRQANPGQFPGEFYRRPLFICEAM